MEPMVVTIAPFAALRQRVLKMTRRFWIYFKGTLELVVDEEKRSVTIGPCFIFLIIRLIFKELNKTNLQKCCWLIIKTRKGVERCR